MDITAKLVCPSLQTIYDVLQVGHAVNIRPCAIGFL